MAGEFEFEIKIKLNWIERFLKYLKKSLGTPCYLIVVLYQGLSFSDKDTFLEEKIHWKIVSVVLMNFMP